MLTSFKFFNKLPGTWSFVRQIANNLHASLDGSVVVGTASFTPESSNEVFYKETGELKLKSGEKFPITQEYFFAYNDTTDHIEKYFSENKIKAGLFYVLGNNNTAEHICINDTYKATYEIPVNNDNLTEFNLTYTVLGPAKDYSFRTSYKKLKS